MRSSEERKSDSIPKDLKASVSSKRENMLSMEQPANDIKLTGNHGGVISNISPTEGTADTQNFK